MSHIDYSVPLAAGDTNNVKESVVNFTDFEHQKENIQPLRRGRSATALALLYGKTSADDDAPLQPARAPAMKLAANGDSEVVEIRVSAHLQAQNAQFQAEISALDPAETDDPLDVYYRYIQWLIEVFPQAVGHQAVIKLVERPIRLFREQERYRNDSRYLKMWIWYCSLIYEGQEAVFQHLLVQKVGDSLAMLYEEYGKLLEGRGKIKKADEVYQLGVARKAQPLARLERRYVEFQRRVMANTMRETQQQQQQPVEDVSGQRTMLGAKRTASSVRSAPANTLPSSQRGLPSEISVRATNSRIAVFTDPDGSIASASAQPTPWLDVGSDEGRRKENLREAATWRGQTLEQNRVPVAAEKFTVFSDDSAPSSASGGQGSVLSNKSLALSSGLLQSFDAKPKATKPVAERMVMPDSILFPAGDGVPQCAEEARAQLPRYRFDYDAWVAAAEQQSRRRSFNRVSRKSIVSSPTINTRAAEQGMLDIWNDLSDSDSESLLGHDKTPKPTGDRPVSASAGCLTDDDYQFTMGPVIPHIVPEELAHRPPVIPTSARVSRQQEPALGGDDMPTVVLNSIRAAKRQEMRLNRGHVGPTPLAMRTQTPVLARRGLRSIGEESSDDGGEHNAVTPAPRRVQVFNDPDAHPAPLQFAASSGPMLHSTPARGSHSSQRPPAGSSRYPHTPGYTRTTTGFSVSGAELTGLSGFTGVSTIGGPTSLLTGGGQYTTDDDDEEEEEDNVSREERRSSNGLAPTPLRKRLSMAAKDFGKMTPRFPKTLPTEDDGHQDDVHSQDDDDDDDDEDDGEEPCTENIGEFADLDSQMNELEMQLGTKFKSRQDESSSQFQVFDDRTPPPRTELGRSGGPPSSVKRQAPRFTIFQD
ncbi:protein kinase [Coemansia sp. S2]|nr:protein kinase [Coemansia sp. S3946]KAJ2069150.1 protein kinase [Coemansia sp. S2]